MTTSRIHGENSKFRFEFGNDRTGSEETGKRAGKQYCLGEILVAPKNSKGRLGSSPVVI